MENNFQTTNRMLEQFLFAVGIKAIKTNKTEDFMTCWSYTRTPRLTKALSSYKEILETPDYGA